MGLERYKDPGSASAMVVTKISSNKLTVATGESAQVWSRKTRSELGGGHIQPDTILE